MYDINESDSSAAPFNLTNPEPESAQTNPEPQVDTAACEIALPEPPASSAAEESLPAEETERPLSDSAFVTAEDFFAAAPTAPTWIVSPWVVADGVTLLDGKAKAGKTSFAAQLVTAVSTGAPFLGQPTTRTKVVYVTEEGEPSFRRALIRAGMKGTKDVIILAHRKVARVPWPQLVERIATICAEKGARLVIIDTLAKFAPGAEGSSAKALEVMGELHRLKAMGVGVIVTRHQRKAGGAVGDSGRGSSALTGDADIVLAFCKPEGHVGKKRIISAMSRFEETPDKVAIELRGDDYFLLESPDVEASEAERAVLDLLTRDPEKAIAVGNLLALAGLKTTTGRGLLARLERAGKVVVTGDGTRGSPRSYHLPAA